MPPISCRMSSSCSASLSARPELPVYARMTAYMVVTSSRRVDPSGVAVSHARAPKVTASYKSRRRLAGPAPRAPPRPEGRASKGVLRTWLLPGCLLGSDLDPGGRDGEREPGREVRERSLVEDDLRLLRIAEAGDLRRVRREERRVEQELGRFLRLLTVEHLDRELDRLGREVRGI